MSFLIPDANILFIHIPKSAGNSMRQWFRSGYKIGPQIPNDRTDSDNYHSTIDDAEKHLGTVDPYILVTAVRNPWARVFSWYCHRRRSIRAALNVKGDHDNRNLNSNRMWLRKEYRDMRKGFNYWLDCYHDRPWDYTWFQPSTPQTDWLGNHQFDYIFRVDQTIAQQTKSMAEELNLQIQTYNLGVKNANPNRADYRDAYDQTSINLIKNLHQSDIERFGFTFND
jgi:hypothetical protein